jgi:serine/threonine protein kinase
MAPTAAKSESLRRLADVLEEARPWTVEDSLRLVRELAAQVEVLHQGGRTHRAINAETVLVDSRLRPKLSPPAPPRRFGGSDNDPEFCPPELAGGGVLQLPHDLQAAAAVLKRSGRELDPRRIDVYQLGTLLCRLITGASIRQYVFSPVVKARVPADVRPLLDVALGHDCLDRLSNCEQFLAALDEALRQASTADGPASRQETPAQGSVIVPGGDTPAKGNPPASAAVPAAADSGELPFARLGHYRVLGRIGRGGMGDVYRG